MRQAGMNYARPGRDAMRQISPDSGLPMYPGGLNPSVWCPRAAAAIILLGWPSIGMPLDRGCGLRRIC
jgi:hypothetical protein